jgi:hypothetical protein
MFIPTTTFERRRHCNDYTFYVVSTSWFEPRCEIIGACWEVYGGDPNTVEEPSRDHTL